MKKYYVDVHYDVCLSVEVNAKNEREAIDLAKELASDMDFNDGDASYYDACVTDVENLDLRDAIKDYVNKKKNKSVIVDDLNIMIPDGDGEDEYLLLSMNLVDDKLYLTMDKAYDDCWELDDLTDEDVNEIYSAILKYLYGRN